ncbi:cytochrome C oxidase subunit IV family protein [Conexibacter sp. SYSU D00693]|uniref:cytochrome C oxidase subunit IV family protein n=1 Tax=Conexibacter sp. SYSU D00693 TaxID=2812560 RepID=UPI00196B5E0A|nr:cytochrome C oxidase subunit IV family protein [Conexibacter sp. SYSU D00693]
MAVQRLSRPVVVFGALLLATFVSLWVGTDHGFSGSDGHTAGAAVALAVAFLKIRWIGLDFMELRHAPLALRVAFEAWVVLVGIAVVALLVTGDAG